MLTRVTKLDVSSHTHTLTHTKAKQSKSKVSSCHKGHAYLAKPGHQAGTVCRCCTVSWSRARNSQEHQLWLSLQVWAPEVPPTPLVINETQPVCFALQYKTRYPFYRWVGWSTCRCFFSPALRFKPVS